MISLERIRHDFPTLTDKAYLNTAAEGIPPAAVGAALDSYWEDKQLGMDGRHAHFQRTNDCREIAARMLGRTMAEVEFCSCSAEAYNLLATALDLGTRDEVVICDLDFPSGATPWLVQRSQPVIKLWKSVAGQLELSDLQRLLTRTTRLVQLSLVSFYNGYRLQWPDLKAYIRKFAPQAIIAVDVTQALGRCVLDCDDADIIISSTHKWALGIHGGCIVAVRSEVASRLTTRAGGWHNLVNAFEDDRFVRAERKPGAASYAVGMPSFGPIYALNSGLRYLESVGIEKIAHYADRLVQQAYEGLIDLGLTPMTPHRPRCASGIIAFRHPDAEALLHALHAERIHIMYSSGRFRLAIHGYNTADDITRLLHCLKEHR